MRSELKSMACYQLQRMIQQGKQVTACKAEWKRRWAMPYPYYRTSGGIAKVE